jgi:hypothetical protein
VLPEITIIEKHKQLKNISSGKIRNNNYFHLQSKYEVVSFINLKNKDSIRLKKIHFVILKNKISDKQKSNKLILKVNIYEIGEDSILIKKYSKIIKQKEISKKNIKVTSDIDENIIFKEGKFALGIEFIGFNKTKTNKSAKLAMTKGKSLLEQKDFFRFFYQNSKKLISFNKKGIKSNIALSIEYEE